MLPDYRLYPQVKFPLFIDDGALAVAWVQQHAQEFGGDPHRIVLMGHSAGGHEAAFLAYDRQLLQKAGAHPEWIVGLVGLSGPYALEPNSKMLNTIFASPYTEADWQPVRFVTPRLRQRCSCTALPMTSSRSGMRKNCATSCRPITCGSKRSSIRGRDTPIPSRAFPCRRGTHARSRAERELHRIRHAAAAARQLRGPWKSQSTNRWCEESSPRKSQQAGAEVERRGPDRGLRGLAPQTRCTPERSSGRSHAGVQGRVLLVLLLHRRRRAVEVFSILDFMERELSVEEQAASTPGDRSEQPPAAGPERDGAHAS